MRANAVQEFIALLSSPSLDIREQAIWGLSNIAGEGSTSRDYVLRAGALPHLLSFFDEIQRTSIIEKLAWTLNNLCRGEDPKPDWQLVKLSISTGEHTSSHATSQVSPALPALGELLSHPDDDIVLNACWAISHLMSNRSNDHIQAVIDIGICETLVDLLERPSTSIQTPALRSINSIVYGSVTQTEVAIACGALPALCSLLSAPQDATKLAACLAISNITAGPISHIQAVIDADAIPPLIDISRDRNVDVNISREACRAISNATRGYRQDPDQVRYLVSEGCIEPLFDMLTTAPDDETIQVVLNGLDNILKVGDMDRQTAGPWATNAYTLLVQKTGGMTTISDLRLHSNPDINDKAFNIIDKYFLDAEVIEPGVGTPF